MLKGDLNSAIKTNMQDGMQNYGAANHEGVDATWDTVQRELKCCGELHVYICFYDILAALDKILVSSILQALNDSAI